METTFDLEFRPAAAADLARIMEIIRQAQAQMRASGSDQWQDGYPARQDIADDLALGQGYVLHDPQRGTVAYGAMVFTGERAYERIEGRWLTREAYVVVHRLAVAAEAQRHGIGEEFLRRVHLAARERGIRSLRIDTAVDNRRMLRLLDRTGFSYCGRIRYASGERLAFERRTDSPQ